MNYYQEKQKLPKSPQEEIVNRNIFKLLKKLKQ